MQSGFVYFGVNTMISGDVAEREMAGEKLDILPMSLWTLDRWYHVAGTWVSKCSILLILLILFILSSYLQCVFESIFFV